MRRRARRHAGHPGQRGLSAPPTPTTPTAPPGPAIGTGGVRALYAAYFAFVGLFSPYLSLWFDSRGLSIGEIAVLLSLPQVLRIAAPPFWGWLADRGGHRVALLRISAVAALVVLLLGLAFAGWFS